MSNELRRLISDASHEQIIEAVNRLLTVANGDQGGRVWLLGDDGIRRNIIGGATLDTGNYPFRARSAAGNHGEFMHSNTVTTVARFQDAGATIPIITGNTRFANNVDVDGTFNADGATTLQSTLVVTGATTLQSTLEVTGVTTLTGALLANGAVTLGNAAADVITVTGTMTVAEILTLTKGLVVDTNTLVVDAVNNKVGILQATPTAALTVNGQFQVTSTTTPSGGAGVEIGYTAGSSLGSIAAFDRDATTWKELHLAGSIVRMRFQTTNRISVDTTGIGFFNTAPVAQPAAGAAAGGTLAQVTTLANDLRTGLRDLGLFS